MDDGSPIIHIYPGVSMKALEKLIESSLFVCAISSIITIALIIIFIVANGLPAIIKTGPMEFIFGGVWNASYNIYGIFPMIVGTLVVTILSLILGVPLGVGCAILIAEVAPAWVRSILRPAIETLAGIPSIVYGLFGLIILVPLIMNTLGGGGLSVLACGIVLAIMILPTVISVSEDAIRSVPQDFREGSLALGATKWQMITGIVLPAAKSGIIAGSILAMGRSIGETMAVLMVGGNVPIIPTSLTSPVEPMTALIALEWLYASGDHQVALFAVGVVLLAIIMALNLIIYTAYRSNKIMARA